MVYYTAFSFSLFTGVKNFTGESDSYRAWLLTLKNQKQSGEIRAIFLPLPLAGQR